MGAPIGRDDEHRALTLAIDAIGSVSSVLLLTGEAGIGKSVVWQSAVDAARDAGAVVLVARATVAEQHFGYAALNDLVSGLDETCLDGLPPPQRRAIDVALRRADPDGTDVDPAAVAFATARLLAAVDAPLVIALDDLQWLDRPSAAVVDYLVSRLPAAGRVVMATWRAGLASPSGFTARPVDGQQVLDIGPLTVASVHHIVKDRLGQSLTRPTLMRIFDLSGGNPLFALELARHHLSGGAQEQPLPTTLREAMQERLAPLSPACRHALTVISALGRPSVERAMEVADLQALAEAESSGVVVISAGRIGFSHPLLAAEVDAGTTVADQVAVHRQLAATSTDVEERAQHLARAATGPDATVAAEIDAAVAAARTRGAPQVAAELAQFAIAVTPAGDPARWARRHALAVHLFSAGETDQARQVLEALDAETTDPTWRMKALRMLAEIAYESSTADEAVSYATAALALAGDDPLAQIDLHATLARVHYNDFALALHHARMARTIAEAQADVPADVMAASILAEAMTAFLAGEGLDVAAYREAAVLEAASGAPPRLADSARAALAADLKYADAFDEARQLLLAVHAESVEGSDEASRPFALSHLPQLELWTGRWDAAEAWASEHLALAETTHQSGQAAQARFNLAMVAAHRGDLEPARHAATTDLADAEATGDWWSITSLTALLGFLAWSEGDAAQAVAHLSRSWQVREQIALREPGRFRHLGDHLEALVALDRLDEATMVVEVAEARARRLHRPSALNATLRGKGLLLAARGDRSGSELAFAEALAVLDRVALPFEVARTQLAQGQALRRAKAKRAARECLTEAERAFTALGAHRWAARAADELSRVGLRAASPLHLTETEELIAGLAASGASTKAIAATAFLSPRTVESNLTRIYRKLGVTSRAELAALVAKRGG